VERAKPLSVATGTEIGEHEVRGTVKFFNACKGPQAKEVKVFATD